MTPQERAKLVRALAALDTPAPVHSVPYETAQRRRRVLIAAAVLGTLGLLVWIVVLALTLPRAYRAGGWRVTWIGFDVGLVIVLALTAWAAWRRRQILILCLLVLATLLFCDAWFDTTLDWHTRGFTASVTLAVLVELPVAIMAIIAARRLLRLTMGRLEHFSLDGERGVVPPFWKVPLFGDESIGYRHVLAHPKAPESQRQETFGRQ